MYSVIYNELVLKDDFVSWDEAMFFVEEIERINDLIHNPDESTETRYVAHDLYGREEVFIIRKNDC